ncbi:MAG: ribonuclease HI [Candidatus Cloacimonadota bacterium]|nr:MAG: ribonuclease HI [Candidatus Cloacimonadota bacterium]PIE81414.1 MAG: ribonuclease HI [Candidatus Delongbacteria bacterium]
MQRVEIYTDGACSYNPGPGGWCSILFYKEHKKVVKGYKESTTNNVMELTAVIEALKALKKCCQINIYTDSMYVKKGITSWISNWIRRGWKTSSNQPVKNMELWKKLYELSLLHEIEWHWVKAHSENELNNEADFIAREQIKVYNKK